MKRSASPWGLALALLALTAAAAVVGLAGAILGGPLAAFLLVPLLVMVFVFVDYRVGVVGLFLLLPWASSPLLPQARGLNFVNYFFAVTLLSFALHALRARAKIHWWPKDFFLFYLLPVMFGFVVAIPYLGIAARNFSGTDSALTFTTVEFFKSRVIFSAVYIVFAFLLCNAVKESKRPERFVALYIGAGILPAIAVFTLIQLYGVSLSDLQVQRSFMKPLGIHANEMAAMLAFVAGPALFVLPHWKTLLGRGLSLGIFCLVVLALLLTFSRGGFVALLTIIAIYIFHRRQFLLMVFALILMCVGIFFAPSAFKERWLTGVERGAVQESVGNLSDPLTAGRVAVWEKLIPEVAKSPLWGRGLSSTAWSDLVRSGVYKAIHPHNMYLAILMDLGFLGLCALLFWYTRIISMQLRLYRSPELSPVLRNFFLGSVASFAGVLLMNVTNGNFLPRPEYSFFWFCMGLLFAFWLGGADRMKSAKAGRVGAARARPWGAR